MRKNKDTICCKEATRLMSKGFEKELTLREKIALKAHLAICKTCELCFRQMKALRNIFSKYSRVVFHLPPHSKATLSPEAKKRIIKNLYNSQNISN